MNAVTVARWVLILKLCGKSYHTEAEGYIYVNEIGGLLKPGYITQQFPLILEKYGLRKIRFHDLRHSCASLLYVKRSQLEKNPGMAGPQRYFYDL